MKKILAPILLLLVVSGLGYAIYLSFDVRGVTGVTGLIGSEKKAFFADPEVQKILKDRYKLEVVVESAGSRRIGTTGGARGRIYKYDFGFPAGTPAAEKIRRDFKSKGAFRVFFTPMTIASWQPVVEVLERNGIVTKRADHYAILDMNALLGLMMNDTRWADVPNNDGFSVGRRVLIKSTDIASSNSAVMYLSLASYLANSNSVVRDNQQLMNVMPRVAPLFTSQGFMTGSSATPFEDYLIKGMGNSPLVMIYESQFLYQASLKNGSIRKEMVLLYPEPTIFTQHTLIAMTEEGKRLGEALAQDKDLQKLAIANGYRSNDVSLVDAFQKCLNDNGLKGVPVNLTEVIDPPTYEMLEKMITRIEQMIQ